MKITNVNNIYQTSVYESERISVRASHSTTMKQITIDLTPDEMKGRSQGRLKISNFW